MPCESCGNKPKNDSRAFTKATVEINNPEELTLLRKVIVPASMGDDIENPPKVGKYCNVILYYEASEQGYLYSSDGIPTKVTTDLRPILARLTALEEEDVEIWNEIHRIEMASDVVDVVGTYADLQTYDTSDLNDKDLIKVLQDETHDDAITYYRWSTTTHTFSYVGEEGPYYTQTQTDILLAGKQDTLIAGDNISIAADGKTISAKTLTYFYTDAITLNATTTFYKDSGLTAVAKYRDVKEAIEAGRVEIYVHYQSIQQGETDGYNRYVVGASDIVNTTNDGTKISFYTIRNTSLSCLHFWSRTDDLDDNAVFNSHGEMYYNLPTASAVLKGGIKVGTTLSINDAVLDAKDMVGATSSANGSAGYVPAPLIADQDKYLKGDGTWGEVSSSVIFYASAYPAPPYTQVSLYKDAALTDKATWGEVYDAAIKGNAVIQSNLGYESIYWPVVGAHYEDTDNNSGWYQLACSDRDKNYVFDSVSVSVEATDDADGRWEIFGPFLDSIPTASSSTLGGVKVGSNLTISSGVLSANTLAGTDGVSDGTAGYAPAPLAADAGKYLKSDGTWAVIPAANNISSNDWSALWQ